MATLTRSRTATADLACAPQREAGVPCPTTDNRKSEYEVADACDIRLIIVPPAVVVVIVVALAFLLFR
jgi:hypothetical protein